MALYSLTRLQSLADYKMQLFGDAILGRMFCGIVVTSSQRAVDGHPHQEKGKSYNHQLQHLLEGRRLVLLNDMFKCSVFGELFKVLWPKHQ